MKMELTECSETLAFKLQTPVNYKEESIRNSLLLLSQTVCLYMSFGSVYCMFWPHWPFSLSNRYYQLLLLENKYNFLNFKFKKVKTIYGNLVRLNSSHINNVVNIHY
jgi:hypothetical protein